MGLAGAAAVVAACVSLALVVIWVRVRYLIVIVYGKSMEPTFQHGQCLLARRAAGMPRVGQVVVAVRPSFADGNWSWTRPSTGSNAGLMVKRVAATSCAGGSTPQLNNSVLLLGDNALFSTDSRAFGPVPIRYLRGVVLRQMPGLRVSSRPLVTPELPPLNQVTLPADIEVGGIRYFRRGNDPEPGPHNVS